MFGADSRGVCAPLANYSPQNRRCVSRPGLCVRRGTNCLNSLSVYLHAVYVNTEEVIHLTLRK